MKQYITWQTFWENRQQGRHIDANINMNWNYEVNPITCKCLSYGNISTDKRMLAVLDIPDSYIQEVKDRFYRSLYCFASEQVTAVEALALCIEWYGEDTFELDEDGFTLIDLRPEEEM